MPLLIEVDGIKYVEKTNGELNTELLGQQLVERELHILELQQENRVLGQQMVDMDLRLLMGGI